MKRGATDAGARTAPRCGALVSALAGFRAAQRAGGAHDGGTRGVLARALRAAAAAPGPVDHAAVAGALRALEGASGGDEEGVIDLEREDEDAALRAEVLGLLRARGDAGDTAFAARLAGEKDGTGGERGDVKRVVGGEAVVGDDVVEVSDSAAGGARAGVGLETFRLNRTAGTNDDYSYTIRDMVVSRRARIVVIMNFMIDVSWLNSVAPQLFTADHVIFVHGMKGDIIETMLEQTFDARMRERITVVVPWTPEYGTVHAKCMLTFCGDAGCRVLIHSANDIAEDWLQRCQGAWQRDFPKKDASSGVGVDRCEFEDMLVHYLSAVGGTGGSAGKIVTDLVVPEVRKYDFSNAGCALVASVPGRHGQLQSSPSTRNRYGLWRLREVLEEEPIDESEPAAVVVQFSSLGSIQPAYLDVDLKGTLFASASRRPKRAENAAGLVKVSDTLQLVFPTLSEVANSNESLAAGGSLPVRAANVHRDHIAKLLHGWAASGSKRSRAMPHIKTLVRYRRERPAVVDWMYLGSANLSGAAWGRPRKGKAKAGGAEYLDVWSFELGVLYTPSRYCPPSFVIGTLLGPRNTLPRISGSSYSFETLAAFQGRSGEMLGRGGDAEPIVSLPLPYELPPRLHARDDVPWHVDVGQDGRCGRGGARCTAALARLGISPPG